jgi:hypothetical protein
MPTFSRAFFIHPVLAGLGIVIVKIANPESVFRGTLEFWPLDVQWDGATASLRTIPAGPLPMQNHVAFRMDLAKEEIFEKLISRGIAARYEPRRPGLAIVGFDDPDGNLSSSSRILRRWSFRRRLFAAPRSRTASWANVESR